MLVQMHGTYRWEGEVEEDEPCGFGKQIFFANGHVFYGYVKKGERWRHNCVVQYPDGRMKFCYVSNENERLLIMMEAILSTNRHSTTTRGCSRSQ
eukprot:m.333172 g.333172  ORF g.333172 m.333172 type:complete len:95 (+) comp17087_c0_seq1:220-504(+)